MSVLQYALTITFDPTCASQNLNSVYLLFKDIEVVSLSDNIKMISSDLIKDPLYSSYSVYEVTYLQSALPLITYNSAESSFIIVRNLDANPLSSDYPYGVDMKSTICQSWPINGGPSNFAAVCKMHEEGTSNINIYPSYTAPYALAVQFEPAPGVPLSDQDSVYLLFPDIVVISLSANINLYNEPPPYSMDPNFSSMTKYEINYCLPNINCPNIDNVPTPGPGLITYDTYDDKSQFTFYITDRPQYNPLGSVFKYYSLTVSNTPNGLTYQLSKPLGNGATVLHCVTFDIINETPTISVKLINSDWKCD